MRKPDFFMVGAPKCGTTAMFSFLSQHPDIFTLDDSNSLESSLGGKQEIHFFDKDLAFSRRPTLEEYLDYFSGSGDHQIVGDASVLYLYSKLAATEIKALCPNARIVIMLRNPIEMMYSWHAQLVFWGDEPLISFRDAICAEAERRETGEKPELADHPVECFFYREIANYLVQVSRYLQVFSEEQVKIIIFDDFKNDNMKIYRDLLNFLGVKKVDFEPEFRIVNSSKRVRNYRLQQWLKRSSSDLWWLRRFFPHKILRNSRLVLQKLNSPVGRRSPLDASLKALLWEEFYDEVQSLGTLLDRDLGCWYKEDLM